MRVNVTSKRPCKLERGDVRRVPQNNPRMLVGYHVCCPRCGFVTPALVGDDELAIDESAELSFSRPLTCTYCRVHIHVRAGQLELVEHADVRNIRFR
ncbi:MAG: hypothetical protein AB7S68_36470 [Polyangiaceae bacterium]